MRRESLEVCNLALPRWKGRERDGKPENDVGNASTALTWVRWRDGSLPPLPRWNCISLCRRGRQRGTNGTSTAGMVLENIYIHTCSST